MFSKSRWNVIAIACVSWFIALHGASAQGLLIEPWSPSHEEVLKSWIDDKVVDAVKDHLALTAEQALQIDALYSAHQSRFAAFAAAHRAEYEESTSALGAPGTRAYVERAIEREERLAKVADAQAALDQQFLDDVHAALTKEQLEHWASIMERLNRMRWLRAAAFYREESVDLIDVLERIADGADVTIGNNDLTDLLRSYSFQVNELVVKIAEEAIEYSRNGERRQMSIRVFDGDRAAIDPSIDPEWNRRFEQQRRDVQRWHQRLRDLTRDTRLALVELIPKELRTAFEEASMREAMRGVVPLARVPSRTFMANVNALPNLSDRQRRDIEALAVCCRHM